MKISRSGLVWGVPFVLVGLFVLLVDSGVWASRPDWLWPLFLMILGGALLIGGAVSHRPHE